VESVAAIALAGREAAEMAGSVEQAYFRRLRETPPRALAGEQASEPVNPEAWIEDALSVIRETEVAWSTICSSADTLHASAAQVFYADDSLVTVLDRHCWRLAWLRWDGTPVEVVDVPGEDKKIPIALVPVRTGAPDPAVLNTWEKELVLFGGRTPKRVGLPVYPDAAVGLDGGVLCVGRDTLGLRAYLCDEEGRTLGEARLQVPEAGNGETSPVILVGSMPGEGFCVLWAADTVVHVFGKDLAKVSERRLGSRLFRSLGPLQGYPTPRRVAMHEASRTEFVDPLVCLSDGSLVLTLFVPGGRVAGRGAPVPHGRRAVLELFDRDGASRGLVDPGPWRLRDGRRARGGGPAPQDILLFSRAAGGRLWIREAWLRGTP
jgi:hypothetical protein